jgi:hypothetical protein
MRYEITCNGRIGELFSSRINCIVGSNDHGEVCVWELVIDLIHFEDDIIVDTCLSKKDIELSRHTSSNWVNSESIKYNYRYNT